ncbi:MAG: hypothetical protein EHM80_06055 [Nitrospiraceae bacterium]|nr:MAG: hypothetical protein EHM80_06055 [Nitrospiraceae bacterium]
MIFKVKWICAFLVLGLLVATQSFAAHGDPGAEGLLDKAGGDHFSLVNYYEEQAQIHKTKAENWEFAAEYYKKFPGEFTGKMTVDEHVAHCLSIAEEFRKAEKQDRAMAAKHRELMRKGP